MTKIYPNEKNISKGFEDASGEFPHSQYVGRQSTNAAALGYEENLLYYGGGDKNVDLDLYQMPPSEYPKNKVRKTSSGHVTEYDDTEGRERILIKHKSGAGVEIRPDGTVVISCGPDGNMIQIVGNDHKMIVERDGQLSYNGNLSMDINGSFDLNVGKDLNINVGGNVTENLGSSVSTTIEKNKTTKIKGNSSQYTIGNQFNYVDEDFSEHIKGDANTNVGGSVEHFFGGTYTLTAEEDMIISADNTNIAANDITVIGASGTIGGAGIVMYGKGATFAEGITAPTFHGALEGNAKTATQAGKAGTAGGLGAGGSAGSEVNVATPNTVNPTSAIITDYLTKSNFGIRQVTIDPGNVIKNSIVLTNDLGITKKRLTANEIRSKLRDPVAQQNNKFIGGVVAEGSVNSNITLTTPSETGRIIGKDNPSSGVTQIGELRTKLVKIFSGKSRSI